MSVRSVDAVDSLGCRAWLERTAATARAQAEAPGWGAFEDRPSAIYLVASGALGLAADAAVTVLSTWTDVPVVRVSTHDAVRFAPRALVVGVSFAGDTPEVLDHLERAASRTDLRLAAVAARGPLLELVRTVSGRVVELNGDAPGPRWAVVECLVALLGLAPLDDVETSRGDLDAALLAFDAVLADESIGAEVSLLARRIDRTMVLAIGAGAIGAVLATRLAHQVEENAKTLAVAWHLPDLAYSGVSGFGQVGDLTRQVLSAVVLHSPLDAAADVARRALLEEIVDEQVAYRADCVLPGDAPLADLLHGVAVADLLSLALARHVGIDPGPVPAIAEMKAAASYS